MFVLTLLGSDWYLKGASQIKKKYDRKYYQWENDITNPWAGNTWDLCMLPANQYTKEQNAGHVESPLTIGY